jgi:hypothetical protein
MSGFRIEIAGLKGFKEELKKQASLEPLIPSISSAISGFHRALEKRVSDVYTLKTPLSSVLIGRSFAPDSRGKTFLRFSLQYRRKPVALGEYRTIVEDSNAISKAPLIKKNNFVRWTPGQWSQRVSVEIVKGKKLVTRGDNNYRRKGFLQGNRIMARKGSKTWKEYPTRNYAGVRADYKPLFGPSLSRLALITYDNDPYVVKSKAIMEQAISRAMGWDNA